MSDIFTQLAAPFPPDRVSWRVGSTTKDKTKGMALAYVDARDVMQRLDDVCGPGAWQCRYSAIGSKTCCEIGVVVAGTCVWKADGAGDTDFEGDKGAFSDAFKRAAVKWGIGRYLYDVDAPWVEIEEAGKSFRIKPNELKRLQNLLTPKTATEAHMQKVAIKLAGAPAEAKPWRGPLKVMELKKKLKDLADDVKACTDGDELSALVGSAFEILQQSYHDLYQWYAAGKDAILGRSKELNADTQRWFTSIEKPDTTQTAAE